MMACPGSAGQYGAEHDSLRRDLAAIQAAGTRMLVSLLPDDELRMLGLADLGRLAADHDIDWIQLPVGDMQAPGEGFEHRWADSGARMCAVLTGGERLVLHCFAGLGRTGTVAARLLVDMGVSPPEAVRLVRAARPGTIQTHQQLRYVLALPHG